MSRPKIHKDVRRRIINARRMIQRGKDENFNEAETRRRIERIFDSVMGYKVLKHLSRESAVRGAGETEHVDFAIYAGEGKDTKPDLIVEIKRVNTPLSKRVLGQASNYAIKTGCEWVLLTNGREWKLYHVSFEQPPVINDIESWNLLTDDFSKLAKKFELISFKSLKKGKLDDVWRKRSVLQSRNLLQAILSESSIRTLRREVKKDSGILVSPEDVVSEFRRLLNEGALSELGKMRISFTGQKAQRRRAKAKKAPERTVTREVSEVTAQVQAS